MKKITTLTLLALSINAYSFDMEDYATTYRATRDAYRKADMEHRLAEKTYITMISASFAFLPMRDVVLSATQGVKLNTCTYWSLCNAALTETKVKAKMESVQNDPLIQKTVDSAELSTWESNVNGYYSSLDSELHEAEEILFKEQASSVTQSTIEYTDSNGDYKVSHYGTAIPGTDPEDYYTSYRVIRDAYLKSKNEIKLARGPAYAARAAYAKAVQTFYNYDNCSNWGATKTMEDMIKDGDIDPLVP